MDILSRQWMADNTLASNPYAERITVVRITPNRASGNLKAYATVQLDQAMEIRDLKILQTPGREPYVKWPESPGYGRPYPLIKVLDPHLEAAIVEHVLAAWRDQVVFIGGYHHE